MTPGGSSPAAGAVGNDARASWGVQKGGRVGRRGVSTGASVVEADAGSVMEIRGVDSVVVVIP